MPYSFFHGRLDSFSAFNRQRSWIASFLPQGGPLWGLGWSKENHPRYAAVFSFAKPCAKRQSKGRRPIKSGKHIPMGLFIRKRLLNYILCIRFFIEVHSIVSASRFFHMPTYLRVVIECQSRFFPFFPAFSRNCPDYFLHTSGSSSFRSLSDLGAR